MQNTAFRTSHLPKLRIRTIVYTDLPGVRETRDPDRPAD